MGGMYDTSRCILIVDDNAVIRRCLRRVLESINGWTVCGEAGDGREGIQKAEELRPDLIILDLSMGSIERAGSRPGSEQDNA